MVQGGDETPGGSDDYTGFELLAPDSSRICRVVRGRRYRPVKTVRKRAKPKPFGGVTYNIEIIGIDKTTRSTSDATTSNAVAVEVTVSGGSSSTSSKRLYGYLQRAVGGRGSPFFCQHGFSPRGMGLGSIRGGATPTAEDADADAELETRSTCSFNPRAQVKVSIVIDTDTHFRVVCEK